MDDSKYCLLREKFLSTFEVYWKDILQEFTLSQAQFNVGNRLRPIIAFGGYLFAKNKDTLSSDNYTLISKVAVSIEMLHKASLLIDDLIDNDEYRHGVPTFHTEFGSDRTIMFALNVVGRATEYFYQTAEELPSTHPLRVNGIPCFLHAVPEMARGGLEELCLTPQNKFDFLRLNSIVYSETSVIIETSLLLGYYASGNFNEQVARLLSRIGDKCGYLFQLMNDMEAFCSQEKNIEHKGALNMDFERERKNLVIAYLYQLLSKGERKQLLTCKPSEQGKFLIKLFQTYRLKDDFSRKITHIHDSLTGDIQQLCELGNCPAWYEMFEAFIEQVYDMCKQRLG